MNDFLGWSVSGVGNVDGFAGVIVGVPDDNSNTGSARVLFISNFCKAGANSSIGDNTTIGRSRQEYAVFTSRSHPADLHGDVLWGSA